MRSHNMKMNLTLMIFIVVSIVMCSSQVVGFGVAPSKYSFDIGDDVEALQLRIINSQQEDLMLSLDVEGPLSEYITLPQNIISVKPGESQKTIKYNIDIPEDLPPGMSESAVIIKNIGGSSSKDEGSKVRASVSIKQKINVFSPYPERFVDGDLFVQAATIQEPITFSAHVKNKGSADTDVSGSISIRTPSNTEVGRLQIPNRRLDSLSSKKIRVSYDGLENSGVYIAQAHLNYADKHLKMEEQFMVGNKEVEVSEVTTGEFNLGEIVRLDLSLDNKWNQEIKDVSAEVEVLSEDGTVVGSSKTTTTDVKAHDFASLQAYWDTEGIKPGTYDIGVRVMFDNIVSEYYFNAVVGADSIDVTSDKVTGKVSGSDSDGEDPNIYTVLMLLVIAIIVINVSWFILIKKKLLKK